MAETFENVKTSLLEAVDPRFIVINATNLGNDELVSYAIASLATVFVVGILIFLAIYLFSDFGAAQGVEEYDPYSSGYSGYQQSYQSRSLDTSYDAINVLYMLEEAFRKLEVDDYECQQRIVCEAHEANAPTKYGRIAGRIQKIIGSAEDAAADEADEEVAAAFRTFRDAAVRGIQQEDCQLVYSAKCPKGLRDIISSGTKY